MTDGFEELYAPENAEVESPELEGLLTDTRSNVSDNLPYLPLSQEALDTLRGELCGETWQIGQVRLLFVNKKGEIGGYINHFMDVEDLVPAKVLNFIGATEGGESSIIPKIYPRVVAFVGKDGEMHVIEYEKTLN